MTKNETVSDIVGILEPYARYKRESMTRVIRGRVLPTYFPFTYCLPFAYVFVGGHLDAVDACAPTQPSSSLSCNLRSSMSSIEPYIRGRARTQRSRSPIYWAKLQGGGGAKRTEKQNLARMARRKPFLESCF